MKKGFLITSFVVLTLCLILVGCGEKKENSEEVSSDKNTSEWFLYGMTVNDNKISDPTVKFMKASQEYETELEPISLLGSQVVAGTNYMFLARVTQHKNSGELLDSADLRVAILYVDLNGNATITKDTKLDITKYALKEVSVPQEQLAGGWTVNTTFVSKVSYISSTDEQIKQATATLVGAEYKPLVILANKTGENEETYEVVLCLKTIVTAEPSYSLAVLTTKTTDGENYSLESIADFDLKDYNK